MLNRLVRGSVPTIGRVRLPFMLTPWGHIWSEATIARFADNSFCLLDGPRYKAAPMALIAQARRDPQNVDHNQP